MSGWDCLAVVSPGLEPAALAEAVELGLERPRIMHGGVQFRADEKGAMKACLWMRVATTVRLRLASFPAESRRRLEEGLLAIDWQRWLPQEKAEISCTAARSRLRHTGMLAEMAERAAGRKLQKGTGGIHLRLDRDRAQVSVDLAGERLHRRGWRQEGGRAPLRETLAAGILRLAEWKPDEPLCDPMCGSGTFVIEAALAALRVPPGLDRAFAFQALPAFRNAGWRELLEESRSGMKHVLPARIFGSDRNGGAVGSARRNAERAGVEGIVEIDRRDVSEAAPPSGVGPGLLVTNPPYGGRLGPDPDELMGLYEALGATIGERFSGWRAFVLAPHRALGEATGLRVDEAARLDNGGLRVTLFRLTSG
ncbi:MAG: THUMP domain-containing class I SAM-dependent RNA methyltransferase [Myxococcota bacterium]